jgi:hypothetical protein
MFTDLYLRTTDPEFRLLQFLEPRLFFMTMLSIILHIVGYVFFVNLMYYCFTERFLDAKISVRLISALVVIMFTGYIGRVLHIKDVYSGYNYDKEKTRIHVNQHYNSWIFIG